MVATGSKSVEDLNAMEPYEFEYFLADIWRRQGFGAKVTQAAADGGIDVLAEKDGERVAIQAKRYARGNPVGVKTIRETSNLTNRPDIDRAVVATSGTFTRSAYKEANDYDVKLYDGDELVKLDTHASASGLPAIPGVGVLGMVAGGALWLLSNPERLVEAIRVLIILFVGYIIVDAFGGVLGFNLPFGV